MRVRTWAVISAGAVLASLVAAIPAQAAPGERGATVPRADQKALTWEPCGDLEPLVDEDLECATLIVPMDHDAEEGSGETVRLALSRVPATGQARHTLLVNPGGPGSAGRIWASHTHRRMPESLREIYDVVSFDPRGVGASTPSISCDPEFFAPVRPDTVPADATAEAALRADAMAYAQACADNTGPLLEHTRTEDIAHDMDAIREALGQEQIDYLGYSYGSYLGTVYSALYPDRVRALLLDSVVDPDNPWYESNLVQSRALERSAWGFFDWVARHDDAYGLGATGKEVAEAYYALRSELGEAPIKDTVGPTELESAVVVIAYSGVVWPTVARALAARINDGDDEPLLRLHERYGEGPDSDQEYGGYLAVQCTDTHWPRDWETWRADAEEVHGQAPFMGWHNIWYNAPCADWAADSGDWFQVGDGPGEHPAYQGQALLVHAAADGATPVEGAFALRRRLPGAALVLERDGITHGVSFAGNTCVDEVIVAYLREGELPTRNEDDGPDVTCQARPEPRPDTARGEDEAGIEPGVRGGAEASEQPVE